MKLGDLCPIISKEHGFYITDSIGETFFQDSDDFYEKPYARYIRDKEVIWIESKNNHLNIIIK